MGEVLKEGTKMDAGKNRLDLLPFDALIEVGKVMTDSATRKYSPRNWEIGMAWGRFFGAAMRHQFDWWLGAKVDKESGFHPLAHAACDILFLLAYELRGTQGDDRPIYPKKDEGLQLCFSFKVPQEECLHLPKDTLSAPDGQWCGLCGKRFP